MPKFIIERGMPESGRLMLAPGQARPKPFALRSVKWGQISSRLKITPLLTDFTASRLPRTTGGHAARLARRKQLSETVEIKGWADRLMRSTLPGLSALILKRPISAG